MRTQLKQKLAISYFTCIAFVAATLGAYGQYASGIIDTGTIVADITLTDINGKSTSLYSYLDQGYLVVLELGATHCAPCWAFHEEGIFESIYQKYGPEGTVKAKKIMPIWIECDPGTTSDDLHGKGSNTQGDWVKGVTHPVIDLKKDFAYILSKLRKSGNIGGIETPTFIVICPDRKVVFTDVGSAAMREQNVIAMMERSCIAKGNATEIEPVLSVESINIYPNPAQQLLHVQLGVLSSTKLTFSISNLLGQIFTSEQMSLEVGNQTTTVKIGELNPGVYILDIKTDRGNIQKSFVIER